MPDVDQITALGQAVTTALVSAYGGKAAQASLVFLPGISVPDDLVQSGIINPTQVQTFLSSNFGMPFVVSAPECEVSGIDLSHGTSQQIYRNAVSYAVPVGDPSDDNWKRVSGLIRDAKQSFGSGDIPNPVLCEPDDWCQPANAGYWNVFDSSTTQNTPPPPPSNVPALPVLRPQFWMVGQRRFVQESAATAPASVSPPSMNMSRYALAASRISLSSAAIQPLSANRAALQPVTAAASASQVPPIARIWFHPIDPIPIVKTGSTSTLTLHLEHQYVTLAYFSAGIPWWDSIFLADKGWYIPGLPQGALLPMPPAPSNSTDPPATYGLPVALVIVRNLRISGQWSEDARAALSSADGFLGPFSLHGAIQTVQADGSVTYSRDGMQVAAMFCSPLPVLPPVDAPQPADSGQVTGAGSGS